MRYKFLKVIFFLIMVVFVAQLSMNTPVMAQGDSSQSIPPVTSGEHLRFTHLTNNDGLSQNSIFAILQDRQGFMWFATRDGLNRYDGYSFVIYKHDPDNPESLSDNFIQDLIEDNQGYLWITTQNGGVNKFDPATERFTHYRHDPDNPNSISGDTELSVFQDSRGYFWFGTEFAGLNKFDPFTETFTCYRNDDEGKFVDRITDITEDNQGNIWFVGNRGLHRVDPKTGQITHPPTTRDWIKSDFITKDETGNLWMVCWDPNALVRYNPQLEELTEYPLDAGLDLASCNLLDDGKNGFWVPSKQGLFHFNRKTGTFKHLFQYDETDPESLNDNMVVSIFQDKAGLLWLGTGSGGLNVLNFQQQQFGFTRHHPSKPNSLSPGNVSEIYVDSDRTLWVGLVPRALDRIDQTTGQINHFVPDPKRVNSLSPGGGLSSILKGTKGYLWLGGWDSGLDRYDERSGQFKHYQHDPNDSNSLISNNVLDIYEDRDSNLWIGQYGGLSRFDRETEKFTNYRPYADDPASLGHIAVRTICEDQDGSLWVGTWGGVLSHFDKKTDTFVNYTPDSRDPQKLNGGAIYSLCEDQNGILWIGATDGLYRFHRNNDTFTHYTENQGLPSSNIQAILSDDKSRLWISTKNGLSRFDTKTEKFKNFDRSDGLQSNDFSENCCARGQNGELFFGGTNGFNAFFPDSIRDNPHKPPVVLTEFQLFNKPVPIGKDSPLKKAIQVADQIILSYNQEVFSIKFAALNYNSPERNKYAFKLDDFDKDWRYTDADNRMATYTRLSPGNYTFHVKASNNDGVWNEQGTSIKIRIIPPWWQTWYARAAAVVFVLALVYIIFLLRVNSIKKHSRKLEKQVAERTEQLNAANKELEAFAYSVSHDLRAPLRGIDGFSQILLEEYQDEVDEQGKNYLQRVRNGAQRMAQLIDDMLNLSRVNRGELTIQQVDLSMMVQEIADNLCSSQPDRKVEFIIQPGIVVSGDNHLLHIVLVNLLGNAWKFTSKHETARIEFGVQMQHEIAVYFVRDDGAGFEMNYAQKLFGAFQRLHTVGEFPGTGVGLATVQRIIHRHGGNVWAEGEVEKGATFFFTLHINS
ncbi:MAG TPA: two-component regulator propeller domain-containing protein [Sunxiuqinia sp.]|nr:two-component regulator propeller domain-containing protein [Sunxiuqinia sp.]